MIQVRKLLFDWSDQSDRSDSSDEVIFIRIFIVWKNIIQYCRMIVDYGSGESILNGCNFVMLKKCDTT